MDSISAKKACQAEFKRAAQIFREFVHVGKEKTYKVLIKSLKEVSLHFVDNLKDANEPTVLRSIAKRTDQHFCKDITARSCCISTRFHPYTIVDQGWDEETDQWVTELYGLAGKCSKILSEIHYRIALLKRKVRQETFLQVINSISLPITTIDVVVQDWVRARSGCGQGKDPWPHAQAIPLWWQGQCHKTPWGLSSLGNA